jgi:tetratricopeptide (TPR) repeat protein
MNIFRKIIPVLIAVALSAGLAAQAPSTTSLLIKSAPGTTIWIDILRFGKIPESGEMAISNLRPGPHTLRACLKGRREITQSITLSANAPQTITLNFTAPADKAELSFQAAEELRERGKHADAILQYRNAIRLRPGFTAAHLAIARSMQVTDQYDEAYAHLRAAMRARPGPFPEAHTITGNLKRAQGFTDDALRSYQTAVSQSKGSHPEPYTGLALIQQDRNRPDEAIKYFRLALARANDTEPVLYFLIGNALEREYRFKEAVEVYEKYLLLEPQGTQAASVRSIIKQLKKEIR